jgi:hypothetical protein
VRPYLKIKRKEKQIGQGIKSEEGSLSFAILIGVVSTLVL